MWAEGVSPADSLPRPQALAVPGWKKHLHPWPQPLLFMPRVATLEKEVAGLREKIHHLDDMLKSQQRKVRQMIEQVSREGAYPAQVSASAQLFS